MGITVLISSNWFISGFFSHFEPLFESLCKTTHVLTQKGGIWLYMQFAWQNISIHTQPILRHFNINIIKLEYQVCLPYLN